MEKICIVKRRKRTVHSSQTKINSVEEAGLEGNKIIKMLPSSQVFEEVTGPEEQSFAMELTAEQSNAIQSIHTIKDLLDENPYGVKIDMHREDGQSVFFNFHFKPMYMARMLDSDNVCEMLQISKSFLNNLIKKGEIRSYKIGRLRRFSLEDILDYLRNSQEKA